MFDTSYLSVNNYYSVFELNTYSTYSATISGNYVMIHRLYVLYTVLVVTPESTSILMALFLFLFVHKKKSMNSKILLVIIGISLRTMGVYWVSCAKHGLEKSETIVRASNFCHLFPVDFSVAYIHKGVINY